MNCWPWLESGQTQYALAEFNYSNVYDHEKAKGAQTSYSDIFYTRRQNWLMPGSVEAIFRGPSADYNGSNWNMTKLWGPKVAGLVAHDKNHTLAYGQSCGNVWYGQWASS